MAISTKPAQRASTDDRPFAHLRATPAERERILSALTPFDGAAWRREVTPATQEELAGLEEFLHEREHERRQSLELEQKLL